MDTKDRCMMCTYLVRKHGREEDPLWCTLHDKEADPDSCCKDVKNWFADEPNIKKD